MKPFARHSCTIAMLVAALGAQMTTPGFAQKALEQTTLDQTNPGKVDNTAHKPANAEPVDGDDRDSPPPGNPVAGRKVYQKCASCHALERGRHKRGPSLHKIIDKPSGAASAFKYSNAMRAADIRWTEDALFAFLEDPDDYMPGNKMRYGGLKNPQDRIDLIAYLVSIQ